MDKISKNKQKKIETVGVLEEKVKRAKAVVLTDYRGLKHQQLESLKKALKTVEAELVVTKNTLLARALGRKQESGSRNQEAKEKNHDSKFIIPDSSLTGPTATLFAYNDVIAPLRELGKTIKLLKLPAIKLGILEGRTFSAEQILQIANFPSREILISQLVRGMKAPIYGLHRALNWNLQKLVTTLKVISDKKQVTSS